MTLRLVVTDLDLALADIECRPLADGLDPAPWAAHEVLVVTADEELLGEAGRWGLHRLVPGSAEATSAAVTQLCGELDRR